MALNKVSLSIAGLSLLISTPEDEEYVQQIAREIDENINLILEKSSGASVTNAVLLSAIDYLDSYKKANRNANNMRVQIKDYMAEAASVKLLYDEECKKSAELTNEIQALRSHLTRIATEGDASGVVQKMREEKNEADKELQQLRKQNGDLTAQNKALAEKSDAMNSYIAGQDREVARLSAVSEELSNRLNDKTNVMSEMSGRLAAYESEIAGLMRETNRLKEELSHLEYTLVSAGANSAPPEDVEYPAATAHLEEIQPGADVPPWKEQPAETPLPDVPASEIADQPAQALPPDIAVDFQDETPKGDEPPFAQPAELPKSDSRMAAYDIDLSDLPVSSKQLDNGPRPSDDFSEFGIDDDDTILGFTSVPRDRAAEEAERMRMQNKENSHMSDIVRNVSLVLDELSGDEDQEMDAEVLTVQSSTATFEPPVKEVQPKKEETPLREMPPAEKPKRGGRLEQLVQQEEDDSMPNLSWTLDI